MTYDIEPLDIPVEEFIKNNLTPFNLSAANLKYATGSEYTSKWFFKYSSKYPELTSLLDSICELNEENFEDFDKILDIFSDRLV